MLCIEKIYLGFPIYLNVSQSKPEDLNKDIVDNLCTQLSLDEFMLLIKESMQRV